MDTAYKIYVELDGNAGCLLSRSNFKDLYEAVNLYVLRADAAALVVPQKDMKKLQEGIGLLSDELEFSRAQQIDALRRLFVMRQQPAHIVDQCKVHHFVRDKDPDARKKKIFRAMKSLASLPPLDILCAVSIYKRAPKKGSAGSAVSFVENDVSIQNGLI